MNIEALQYPIGNFVMPTHEEAAGSRVQCIARIGDLPKRLSALVAQLEAGELLDTSYRPGGWSAQQLVHHLADSHFHAYRRHKVTLIEDHPTLVPYDENAWSELPDVMAVPVHASVDMLRGLQLRWAVLLSLCTDAQWLRTAYHPGSGITYRLDQLAAHYAWHGDHHLGHLQLIVDAG